VTRTVEVKTDLESVVMSANTGRVVVVVVVVVSVSVSSSHDLLFLSIFTATAATLLHVLSVFGLSVGYMLSVRLWCVWSRWSRWTGDGAAASTDAAAS